MTIAERHDTIDVFTPTKPARLTFVERENLNEKIVAALKTPGKQVIIYGHTGSGKTTLLVNKLQQLYEKHLITRCVSHLTFEHLVLDAFDQLAPFYTSEQTFSKTRGLSATIKAEYIGLQPQVKAHLEAQAKESIKRILPPRLTPQALAHFLGGAGICWVLEDFHKIPTGEKIKLAQVMKVFMDMSDQYKDLKLVAIGAVDTARQVVDYDPEMFNRVAEINVPLMSDEEIKMIGIVHKCRYQWMLTDRT